MNDAGPDFLGCRKRFERFANACREERTGLVADRPVVAVIEAPANGEQPLAEVLRDGEFAITTYRSPTEFLDRFEPQKTACLVVDVTHDPAAGLTLQANVQQLRQPPLPVVFVSGAADVTTAVAALKGGANDFLAKPCESEPLRAAVSAAVAHDREACQACREAAHQRHRLAQISPRERQILDGLTNGRTVEQIASELGISPKTVYMHRSHLMDKLRCDSLAELIRFRLLVDDAAKPAAVPGH